ncbi:hypothetical protein T459_30668 [Capsicum annuum]|uniref:Photosystem II protein D1 n=1 Tax=Capsicum annuum TaxID=4072 RepID=A0A2G2Y905_CAPAN|nr:hypothetical protein T459_30668 [Capsicum annuum]
MPSPAPPVDIDGIREPVSGSLLYGNNIISGAIIPTSAAIGLHFYPIWEAASVDEWLYNGGPYELIVLHFLLGVACYMGREWELSFRLGIVQMSFSMLPVIALTGWRCFWWVWKLEVSCCSSALWHDRIVPVTSVSVVSFTLGSSQLSKCHSLECGTCLTAGIFPRLEWRKRARPPKGFQGLGKMGGLPKTTIPTFSLKRNSSNGKKVKAGLIWKCYDIGVGWDLSTTPRWLLDPNTVIQFDRWIYGGISGGDFMMAPVDLLSPVKGRRMELQQEIEGQSFAPLFMSCSSMWNSSDQLEHAPSKKTGVESAIHASSTEYQRQPYELTFHLTAKEEQSAL